MRISSVNICCTCDGKNLLWPYTTREGGRLCLGIVAQLFIHNTKSQLVFICVPVEVAWVFVCVFIESVYVCVIISTVSYFSNSALIVFELIPLSFYSNR